MAPHRNSLTRQLGREYLHHRLRSRGHRYPRYGRGFGGLFQPTRHRTGTNVRVFGCCLPGCGAYTVATVALTVAGGKLAARRRRG